MSPIDEKIRESCLRWFGHVQRRAINAPMWEWIGSSWGNEKNIEEDKKIILVEVVNKKIKKCISITALSSWVINALD